MTSARTPSGGSSGRNFPDPISPNRTVSERMRRARLLQHRWLVLALCCIIPLGSHYIRKELGPLKTAMLADKEFALNNTRFAMLLSATALPNLLVPVFGGVFLDMRGSRRGTMIFLVITLIGQALFIAGAHLRMFSFAILAQLVVGIGAGSTVVSQAAISSEYFRSTEMGLAVGIMESAHNLSNWMGQALPAQLSAFCGTGYTGALYFGLFMCFISLAAGFLYFKTDLHSEKLASSLTGKGHILSSPSSQLSQVTDVSNFRHMKEPVHTTILSQLPPVYFGLAVLHLFFSTAHQCFDNISANLITVRYGDSAVEAGLLASVDDVFGLLLAPIVGLFLDRMGYRLECIAFLAALLTAAQLLLAFTRIKPILPLILLGIVNSSVPTILRSSVPLVVAPSSWGVAFGIFEAFEAMGTFTGNLSAGLLRDLTATYVWVNIGFAVFGIVCLFVALLVSLLDGNAIKLKKPLPSTTYCHISQRRNGNSRECNERKTGRNDGEETSSSFVDVGEGPSQRWAPVKSSSDAPQKYGSFD